MEHSEKTFQILDTLDRQEISTQRQLAEHAGISLGQVNYIIKSLLEKGLVKIGNFRKNPRKIGYVYLLTKAIYETYNIFKDAHPALTGWEMKKAIRPPAMAPFHNGAIRFFKEIGAWTKGLEDWNTKALAQEERRLKEWEKASEEGLAKKISDKKFRGQWMDIEAKVMAD